MANVCYYPNKDVAKSDVPCNTDGRPGPCCGKDAICLSNNLCLSTTQPYTLTRGSCTDRTWSSGCPTWCRDAQLGSGSSLVYLNGSDDSTLYCCNSVVADRGKTVCSNLPGGASQTPFTVTSGEIIPDVAGLSGLVRASNSSSSAPNNTEICVQDSSRETAIGAGVGVPLGIIALGCMAWAVWERRARQRTTTSSSSEFSFLERNQAYDKSYSQRPVGELPASLPEAAELGDELEPLLILDA